MSFCINFLCYVLYTPQKYRGNQSMSPSQATCNRECIQYEKYVDLQLISNTIEINDSIIKRKCITNVAERN